VSYFSCPPGTPFWSGRAKLRCLSFKEVLPQLKTLGVQGARRLSSLPSLVSYGFRGLRPLYRRIHPSSSRLDTYPVEPICFFLFALFFSCRPSVNLVELGVARVRDAVMYTPSGKFSRIARPFFFEVTVHCCVVFPLFFQRFQSIFIGQCLNSCQEAVSSPC